MSEMNYEQGCVIKFCVKMLLNRLQSWRKHMKMTFCHKHIFLDDITYFQMDENQFRMLFAPEDHNREEVMKMLKNHRSGAKGPNIHCRTIAEKLNLNSPSGFEKWTGHEVCAKFIPKKRTVEQKTTE